MRAPPSGHLLLCSVQFSHSAVSDSATSRTAARQASLSITNSQSLLKLMSIESVMPPNHLILCRPLLLLPTLFPSIKVFSNEAALPIRWPKCWSFSFSVSPSNKYSGLISFRMDCSLRPHRLYPARLLCPWNCPGKNTGVDCHFLLQGIFLTQGSNLCLLHLLQRQVDSLSLVPYSLIARLVKNPPCSAGDLGLIPGSERSPGEGKGYPLQYSGLENSMDCIVHGVTKR